MFKSIRRILKLLLLLIVVISLSKGEVFGQDEEKLDELNRRIDELNKQIEGCGTDVNCLMQKASELEKLTNEVLALENKMQSDSKSLTDGLINSLPEDSEFPPPFDKITKLWLSHTMASSRLFKLNCETIKKTGEEIIKKIKEIYEDRKDLIGPSWPIPISECKDTYVNIKEHGFLDQPKLYHLEYDLAFSDPSIWVASNYLLVGDKHLTNSDKFTFLLGLAEPHKRFCTILNYRGWILDQSTNPPTKRNLSHYEILEQDIIDLGVQVPSYKGYTTITPSSIQEDIDDKNKLGLVTEYGLTLPYQIVRFSVSNRPDLYIDTDNMFMQDFFTPDEILNLFHEGKFKKTYSSHGLKKEIEIGFPSLGCGEQLSSRKGAIILNGDCIDHGGYVIASDKRLIVNKKPVAKIGDKVLCYKHGETEIVAVGKRNMKSNKKPIARIGDKTRCGAKLLGGSRNTFVGDK
jgi:uncharacterized Zn-binding protein involved in type VI secretion